MERTQEARVPSSSRAISAPSSGGDFVYYFFFHLPLSFLFFLFFHFTLVPIFLYQPSFPSIAWLLSSSHSFTFVFNPHLRQDGSLDAFQVASGHGHHSGDYGCCFGWYVSWLIPVYFMITYWPRCQTECYNVETVFLQDPHTGEQYQFGESKSSSLFGSTLKLPWLIIFIVNVLPRALFGRAVQAAELSKSRVSSSPMRKFLNSHSFF